MFDARVGDPGRPGDAVAPPQIYAYLHSPLGQSALYRWSRDRMERVSADPAVLEAWSVLAGEWGHAPKLLRALTPVGPGWLVAFPGPQVTDRQLACLVGTPETTDEAALAAVATQLTLAVQLAQTRSDLQSTTTDLSRHAAESQFCREVGAMLRQPLSGPRLQQGLARQLREALALDVVWIWTEMDLRRRPVEDHADLTPDRREAAEARRAAELALSRGHSRGADSPAQHIGVPLVLAGTVRGVVVARLTRQQVGAQAELTESLRALAPQIAVALDYGRLPHRSGADSPDAVARPDALREGAGALGHELNNLLASICLQAEVGLDLAEDSEVQESFRSVRTSILKAARIVQRLQGLTGPALSAPSGELVDMGELVRDVLERQWPVWHDQAALSGVMLLLRSELGDDLHVLGSRSELRDLVMKLMQNALEAMPRGGEMDLQLLRTGQEVILRVRDTGLGMTPEVLEHACDPFYSSKHDDHVGLGLAVARSVCVAGHGRLVLSSEVDVGTTVEAVFPVANAAASRQAGGSRQDAARPDTTDETPLATLSVLVADDDPSFLHSMVLLLRRLGHRVSSACDGREATNLLRYGGPFDILLLDLSMPEMGGWEVAGLARKLQPQAAVLLLTGWGEQAATVNDGRLDRVLAKPISLEALAEALDGLEACRQGQSSIPAARVSSA